ncbi:MAG: hypothetical protein LBR90_05115, partial [Elusimicrobiota bacterium]|nr:hypothetical protein [Elusimicrobiota bacterium]
MDITAGLPNISASAFYLTQKTKSASVLFVCKTEEELEEFAAALKTFTPPQANLTAVILGEDKFSLYSGLYDIYKSKTPLVAAVTYETAQLPLPGKKDFAAKIINLQVAQTITRANLLAALESAGYERNDFTEKQGQYAVRGSVVDIFNAGSALPCRAYFSGNTVTTLTLFDIETQNTKTNLDELDVVPLKFEEQYSTLQNWVKDAGVYLQNPREEDLAAFNGSATLITTLNAPNAADAGLRPNANFNTDLNLFNAKVEKLQKENYKIILYCLNRGELDRLQEVFESYGALSKLPMTIAPLQKGFYSPLQKFAYFTSSEVLSRSYRGSALIKKFDNAQAKRVRFKELEAGDYIVHQEHGIGRYSGMETLESDGIPVDCLVVEFKRGEKLYVPINDFRKIQKYIGLKGKAPKISSLSGNAWKEVKKRVKEDAQKTAKEILKLEALRQANAAETLFGNDHMEREFEDSFPYEQTEDQTKAIAEILSD